MTEERIDIIVNDKIAKSIRPAIVGIGNAAQVTNFQVKSLADSLSRLNGGGLQALNRNINANSLASLRQAKATQLTLTAQNQAAIASQKLATATAQATSAQNRAAQSAISLSNAQNRVASSNNTLSNSFRGLGGALGTYFSVRELAQTADAYTAIQNKIRNVTTSSAQLAEVQDRLFKLANDTRTDISATTDGFVRFDKALRNTGAGQAEVLRFTESLNKTLITAGRTTGEVNSIVVQLGQALTSGRLQGDEFRSLSENLPIEVLKAFAKELGIGVDELKKASSEGKITADIIRDAFANSAGAIDAAFAKSVPTIGQAFVVLNNGFTQYIGQLDTSIGLSRTLSQAIMFIGQNFSTFAPILGAVAAMLGIALVGALVAATSSVWAFTAALLANPFGLLAVGLVAAGLAVYNFRDIIIGGFNSALSAIETFINQAIYMLKGFLEQFNFVLMAINGAISQIPGAGNNFNIPLIPHGNIGYVDFGGGIPTGGGPSASDKVRGNGSTLRPEGDSLLGGGGGGGEDKKTKKLTDAQKALKSIYDETIGAVKQLTLDQNALNEAYANGWLGLDEYNKRLNDLGIKALELKITMGDATFFDALQLGLAKVVEGYEGVLSGLSDSFGSFFTSVTDGFANSIGRAIVYGEDLGAALQDVARSALSELISGLVKLGIQWLLMNTIGAGLQAAAGATTAAVAGGVAAAWAPAAALASLATGGANAAPAAAALSGTTALSATLAAVGGVGFMTGGYTGDIPANQVAGAVHGREYVFDADATKRIGVDNLEALRQNSKSSGSGSGSQTGYSSMPKITINNNGTPQDYNVKSISRDEIILIARDQVRSEAPKVVAGELKNPNSRTSKALGQNTTAGRVR